MPGLLGPTNPVPGYDAQTPRIQTPAPSDTSVQNIVNPEVVTRPDSRTDQQSSGDASGSGAARFDSSFMTFLQRLRDSGDVPQTFLRILMGICFVGFVVDVVLFILKHRKEGRQ